MNWVALHYPEFLIGLGLLLLVIEVTTLNLSVLVLLFIGLACIASGVLMWLGLVPETLLAACGSVALLTLVCAALLWKPLKKLQRGSGDTSVKGDFIGHRFVLEQAVSTTEYGAHRFSGVNWKVRSDAALPAGTAVEVVKVEVGFLTVAPAAD
jgi:membrane protein implicated in regulation of membrane protease activity